MKVGVMSCTQNSSHSSYYVTLGIFYRRVQGKCQTSFRLLRQDHTHQVWLSWRVALYRHHNRIFCVMLQAGMNRCWLWRESHVMAGRPPR